MDHQRAKIEDPVLIKDWIKRFHDTIESMGFSSKIATIWTKRTFITGVISTAKVIGGSETRWSRAKIPQPGNQEWLRAIVAVDATG
jgi:hypothetical protein